MIAIVIGAASALANNLPVSASATALLCGRTLADAASIGLAVGALATPQGSVATLIATDLAGPDYYPYPSSRLAPLALASVLIATLLLWDNTLNPTPLAAPAGNGRHARALGVLLAFAPGSHASDESALIKPIWATPDLFSTSTGGSPQQTPRGQCRGCRL